MRRTLTADKQPKIIRKRVTKTSSRRGISLLFFPIMVVAPLLMFSVMSEYKNHDFNEANITASQKPMKDQNKTP